MRHLITVSILLLASFLTACEEGGASGAAPDVPYTTFFSPLPTQPFFPADNPFSDAKAMLGEFLFWDPILSGRMNTACASCHHPDFGWADGRQLSIGSDGAGLGPLRSGSQETAFHSPTVLNSAFVGLQSTTEPTDFVSGPYFWDLRSRTLEEQALDPILNEVEMRSDFFTADEIFPEIESRLARIPEYRTLFDNAFDSEPSISMENVAKALATFQRTLTTAPTRFDEFIQGDESALSAAEILGLNKFINAGCTDCHAGPMLSDFQIHVDQPIIRRAPAVRTPSLRNVALSPPFMHDGSRRTLRAAISLYEERGDLDVRLEEGDFGDIERFLMTLNDEDFYQAIPVYAPSQLPVGGDVLN